MLAHVAKDLLKLHKGKLGNRQEAKLTVGFISKKVSLVVILR